MDTRIIVWKDSSNFTLKYSLFQNKRQIQKVIQLVNSGYIVTASDDFTIKILTSYNEYQFPISILIGHTNDVFDLVELPNRNKMASCSKDRSIIIWNLNDFSINTILYGHLRAVLSLVVITNSNYLASSSCDKTILIWDESFKKIKTLKGHTDCVNILNYYKTQFLLSGSNDKTLIIWNAETFELLKILITSHFTIF